MSWSVLIIAQEDALGDPGIPVAIEGPHGVIHQTRGDVPRCMRTIEDGTGVRAGAVTARRRRVRRPSASRGATAWFLRWLADAVEAGTATTELQIRFPTEQGQDESGGEVWTIEARVPRW